MAFRHINVRQEQDQAAETAWKKYQNGKTAALAITALVLGLAVFARWTWFQVPAPVFIVIGS